MTAHVRCLFAAAALLVVAAPVLGQTKMEELLSGKAYPLSIKLQDLNSDWRRVTVRATASVSGNVSVNVAGNSSAPTSQNNLTGALTGSRNYLTRGQTVSAGGRTYLVAYPLPSGGLDIGTLVQAVATKTPSAPATLTADSTLPLSLLDLESLSGLEEIRPFDLQSEIAESEKAAQALANLLKSQNGGTNKPPASTKRDSAE